MSSAEPGAGSERPCGVLAQWWLHTLPPLDGRLRFVVYALLFVLSWTHVAGILAGPELVYATPAYAYTPRGLAAVFLEGRPSAAWVMPLRTLTALAWVAAALGLGSRPAALITAIGAFVLNGVTAGIVGSNHGWYLPVATLIALVFARSDDRFSADFYIRRWRGLAQVTDEGGALELGRTGFARALVLVGAVAMLFLGGVEKLRASGLEWLDGVTLHSYIETQRFELLGQFLVHNLWACALLSWLTLALELGAPLALFSRRARHLMAIVASCFHLGIALVMVPRYAQYVVCYLLLIDWQAVRAWLSRFGSEARAQSAQRARLATPAAARLASVLGMSVVGGITLVMVLRIEWWPLTHVPMYSTYVSKQRVGDVHKADLRDPERAPQIASDCLAASPCPWALPLRFAQHVRVRVVHAGQSYKLGSGVPPSQWKLLVSEVAMRQLSIAARVGYRPDDQPEDTPVQAFLRRAAPELRASLPAGSEAHVVFEYKMRGGFYTMGHLRLEGGERSDEQLRGGDGAGAALRGGW